MAENQPVARGDRRDEMRYEADPDQGVKVRHTFPPNRPLPPQEHSAGAEAKDFKALSEATDAAVTLETPSVWEARSDREDQTKT